MQSHAPVVFDRVWKKFRRGERHDSLRDMIPSAAKRLLGRAKADTLGDQEFWAVEDLSFEVKPGEALGIIGVNGAGKSTVLKLLTKILRPSHGRCRVTGRVGALIEVAAGFHPDLTALENIYLQGAILGMKRSEIKRRLDSIIEFAGIGDFIGTPVKRYSSGMQARLGFAIAAHIDPDVLLIDEVLAVGDTAFQRKCERRLEEFRDQGVAIVLVSHNLNAVLQLCGQALLLDRGRARAAGPTAEVLAVYSSSDASGPSGAKRQDEGASIAVRVQSNGANGNEGVLVLAPGDRVSLDVDVAFQADVRRAVLLVAIWDMTRNFSVYGATSESIGIPTIRAASGDRLAFAFAFSANLTRGVYEIEVTLYDLDRTKPHVPVATLRSVRQFRIVEDVSHHGLANLYLSGSTVPMSEHAESQLLA